MDEGVEGEEVVEKESDMLRGWDLGGLMGGFGRWGVHALVCWWKRWYVSERRI